MCHPRRSNKKPSVPISAAAHLIGPQAVPEKWRCLVSMPEEQNVRLHLLRSLSRRTDIFGILAEHCPLSNAVEQAFRQWFTDIYPAFLRQYFSPVVNIYFRPEGDPDLDTRRFLRIEVSSNAIACSATAYGEYAGTLPICLFFYAYSTSTLL